MSYNTWFHEHAKKHADIIKKLRLKEFTQAQIIDYFDFNNMVEHEKSFCQLYTQNRKCHEIKELNCYLCACPNFRFDDSGFSTEARVTKFSFCNINSNNGKEVKYGNAIHQDCSGCTVPHNKEYVTKHFDYDWKKIMKKCQN
ncbi:MAG: hypothetical protein U9P71_00135 [Campylobacterota bacterium]|nr:hypothetical protein [Campylobacterota bacterium]